MLFLGQVSAIAARKQVEMNLPKQSSFNAMVAADPNLRHYFYFKRGTYNRRRRMKNLVRGGAVLSVLALFVALVYAQTNRMGNDLIIANDSLTKIENNLVDNNVVNNIVGNNLVNTVSTDDEKKKLVKKTGSSSAAGAGASKGSFVATAYCLQGRTAMGHGVRRGIIAADPRVLKLGSRITISGGYSGSYLVSDTGGMIKGKRLDIWMPSCSEARRFGRRTVQVYQ